MIAKDKKFLFFVIYFIVLLFTIYFSYAFISSYIQQKREYELFKQSWQYVADTNFETEVEIDEETNEERVINLISTPEQLAGAFLRSSGVQAESATDMTTGEIYIKETKTYKLTCNVDLSGKTWISSDFSGTFDGGSFIISNLSMSTSSTTIGFVAKMTSGEIKNLFLDNIKITYAGSSSSACKIGAVCGELEKGTIQNVCVLSGKLTGKMEWGSSASKSYIGGIVGYMQGYSESQIINCSNKAEVVDGLFSGGIVGYIEAKANTGNIENCRNYGNISVAPTIAIYSYNYSSKPEWSEDKGSCCVGGIVGCNGGASISNCTNSGTIISQITVTLYTAYNRIKTAIYAGGIVGYTTIAITKCMNFGTVSGGNTYNKTTYVGGIAGYSSSAITNCANLGNLTCYSQKIVSSQYFNNTNTELECIKVFRAWGLGWRDCWLKVWSGSYKEENTKDISQYIEQSTYNSYAGGIVGYSNYNVTNCYNTGNITANKDTHIMRKMLTAELWYNTPSGFRASDTFVYNFSVTVPTNISGINGNREKSSSNCYCSTAFGYSTSKYINYYVNWNRSSTETGTTSPYVSDSGSGAWGWGTQDWTATTYNKISVSYSNNTITCQAYMKNSATGNDNTSSSAQNRYAINESISFYSVNYTKSTPSAANLDSSIWTSNSNINGGKPYIKDMYW